MKLLLIIGEPALTYRNVVRWKQQHFTMGIILQDRPIRRDEDLIVQRFAEMGTDL